jgi:cytochrome c oxidase subunit 2
MSVVEGDGPEPPGDDEPTSAAEVVRGRMNWPTRIFGIVACVIVGLVFLVQVIAAFNDRAAKPLNTLNPQGPNAQTINNLVWPVFAIGGVVGVAVIGAVIVIGFKFRERPGEDDEEFVHQREGNTALELAWTIAPAVLLAVIGFATVVTIQKLDKVTPGALQVDVAGQQWWWSFRYHVDDKGNLTQASGEGNVINDFPAYTDNDVITANELVVPVGREVSLRETSNDVIHSYWIPNLNGKKDAVPGLYDNWKIEGDVPGVFLGQCTEFCGLSHANMRMLVRVVPQDDFDKWFQNQKQPAKDLDKSPIAGNDLATKGQQDFKQLLCSSCHLVKGINDTKVAGLDTIDGKPVPGVKDLEVSGAAPNLTHFASRGMMAGAILNSHYPSQVDNPDSGSYRLYEAGCTVTTLAKCGNPKDVSTPGNPANPFYEPSIAAWLRDPGKVKPMANTPEQNPFADGLVAGVNNENNGVQPTKYRGMPNLGLSEDQIAQLTAYLETLN